MLRNDIDWGNLTAALVTRTDNNMPSLTFLETSQNLILTILIINSYFSLTR